MAAVECRIDAGQDGKTDWLIEKRNDIRSEVTELPGRHHTCLYNHSERDARLVLRPAFACSRMLDLRSQAPIEAGLLLVPARQTAIREVRMGIPVMTLEVS